MKIRQGFVSNSSSSSFIISDKAFPTVRDLAIYMINKKIEEYEDEDNSENWKNEAIEENKQYIQRLNNIDENFPVSFPSCNYDTYIRKVGDCYLVATCNNTSWDLYDYSTSLTNIAKEELKKIYLTDLHDAKDYRIIEEILNHEYEFSSFGNDFYALDKELLGVEIYEYCNKHFSDSLWDTVKFGKICLICNPYYKRKEKLEIINKISDGAL